MAPAKVDDHALALCGGGVTRLRRRGRAEAIKAHDRIDRRQRKEDGPVRLFHVQPVIPLVQQLIPDAFLSLFGACILCLRFAALFSPAQTDGFKSHRQPQAGIDCQARRKQLYSADQIPEPEVGRDQMLERQHRADVHRGSRRSEHRGNQQADIARLDKGEHQQRQRGQNIALVHLAAQSED